MYDTTNGVHVVGGIATMTLTLDGGVRTTITSTGVGNVVDVESTTASGKQVTYLGTIPSNSWSETSVGTTSYTQVITLQSTVAGVQTITMTPLSAAGVPGTAVTKTVTWTATGTLAVASATAKLEDSLTTSGAAPKAFADQVDTTVALRYSSSETEDNIARVSAKFVDGNGNPITGASVVVSLTGPGILSGSSSNTETPTTTASSQARAFVCTTGAGGTCSTAIKADGSSGKSTITFTSGAISVSKSIDFYGAAASYTILPYQAVYEAGASHAAAAGTGIRVTLKDLNGVLVKGTTPFIFTTDAKVATPGTCTASTAAGYSYCSLTGIAAGTTGITIANNATLSLATVKGTSSITVGSGVATKITMEYDKSVYQPGQAGEVVFTLTSADGKPVADGTYNLAASGYGVYFSGQHVVNATAGSTGYAADLVGVIGAGQGTDIYSVAVGGGNGAGKAIYAFYAPGFASTLSASGTTMTSGNAKLSGTALGATLSAKATVSGGDAAAALAAVNALSTTVASLKTLITTLTNLVLKIQKKVKA
jgi:hypothetical protein